MSTTILFCTDHRVPDNIYKVVSDRLTNLANRNVLGIVSVSHNPINLGDNIAIGPHKSSWLTLYKQLYIGLEEIRTRFVTIAEHDCLYHDQHLNWRPPTDDKFYYNENVWMVQWSNPEKPDLVNGTYSQFWGQRLALSQLVCNRDLYLRTLEKRLAIIDKDNTLVNGIDHIGEPGVSKLNQKRLTRLRKWADSGRPVYLKEMLGGVLELEKYETFQTRIPNLDIRHDNNFTGPRRGPNRTRQMKIPYWNEFKFIMRGGR